MSGSMDGVDAEAKDRAMDAAPVGIVLSDPSIQDNPLVYVNETFSEITGYHPEEILGRNCRFLQGEETDPVMVDQIRSAIDAEEPVTVELLNYRTDGEAFWNEVTIAPVTGPDDELIHFVGFQMDVTDRKEAELALEARTEQLEHVVDRLNGLLFDITEELMHARSREETERVICDRITDTDRYAFAWVGEVSPVDGTVTPTNWSGVVDGLESVTIEGPGAAILAEALEQDTLVTSDNPTGLGGTAAISAVAVCPLGYRRQRYGVLVIGATSPDAFDDPEGAVIEAMGRTISTAIHAAQTRRSLTSSSQVVATFTVRDTTFIPLRFAHEASSSLNFEGAVERRDGSSALFFTTEGAFDRLNAAVDAIEALDDLVEVRTFDEQRLIEVIESSPSTLGWFAQLGANLTSLECTPDHARLQLHLAPDVDGRGVVEEIKARYTPIELVSYTTENRPPTRQADFISELEEVLTDRQQLVLKRAYLSGFYDQHRQITGEEIATSIGISRSTFHQHRRAAERKLIEAFLRPTIPVDD